MAKAKQFVSTIRLTAKDDRAIPAGLPFAKKLLVPHTFNSLKEQGYISEVVQGVAPAAAIKKKPGKALAVGLPNETPDDAIKPPPGAEPDIGVEHTSESANPDGATETAETAEVAPVATTETSAEKPGEGATAAKTDETAKAAKIWTYDPKDLVGLPMSQLLDTYKQRCVVFELNHKARTFNDQAKLREFLSSEFGK